MKNREFWLACKGKRGRSGIDGDVQPVWRTDMKKVKQILAEVNHEQLLELLLWKDKSQPDESMMTGLDLCLHNDDVVCVKTIVDHAINAAYGDINILAVVFPYAVIAKPTSIVSEVLETVPEGSKELLSAMIHRSKQTSTTLENCDSKFYECVLKDTFNHIKTGKDEKDPTQVVPLQLYLLFASERNNSGLTAFHNEDLIPDHLAILDKCMEYLSKNHEKEPVAYIYLAFDMIRRGIPYLKATSCHPLVIIAETNNTALMKHPYIATYVGLCWMFLARYAFYATVILYMFFLFFFATFIASHDVDNSGTDTSFTTPSSALTYTCYYATIVMCLFALFFEFLQARIKRETYFTLGENIFDLVIFIGSMVIVIVSLAHEYNSWTHCIGCILLIVAALRGALILTHMPMYGDKFQMLLSVSMNVIKFLPVLVFFILIFAIVFKSLLQNHDAFDHVGIAIVKTMAMAIGELDFGDIFLDDSNIKAHEIIAFIAFVLFLGIMTISMMNLLIGIAVGDIDALSKQSEQEAFRSKVDLILQYHYMYTKLSGKLHNKPHKVNEWTGLPLHLIKDYSWYVKLYMVLFFWFAIPFWLWSVYTEVQFERKFLTYKDELEREYRAKSKVEQVKDELNTIKGQIDRIMKEIEKLSEQNERLIHLISESKGS